MSETTPNPAPADRELRSLLAEWLDAERSETGPAVAERALPPILAALPAPWLVGAGPVGLRPVASWPPPGFSDRVMARIAASTPRALDLAPRARVLVGLAMILTGSMLALLVSTGLGALSSLDWGLVAGALTSGIADGVQMLLRTVDALAEPALLLMRLVRFVVVRATSPEVLLVLIFCSACTLALLRALHALLRPAGRLAHVS